MLNFPAFLVRKEEEEKKAAKREEKKSRVSCFLEFSGSRLEEDYIQKKDNEISVRRTEKKKNSVRLRSCVSRVHLFWRESPTAGVFGLKFKISEELPLVSLETRKKNRESRTTTNSRPKKTKRKKVDWRSTKRKSSWEKDISPLFFSSNTKIQPCV